MKSKILVFFFLVFIPLKSYAENLQIQSKEILLDKNSQITIFKKEVYIKTQSGNVIKSDYAEYDKRKGYVILKNNVTALDKNKNTIASEHAEYNENTKILFSKGETEVTTSQNYRIFGSDIVINNEKKIISSDKKTLIKDEENNQISLENFNYETTSNIFKSIGYIEITDKMNNKYEFSQIYIDTKKKEILGTDIKAFLNQEDFKINKKNKPRVFANTLKIDNENSIFNKSIFTLCDYRKNDKCPPWTVQSKKMLHDKKKKTIYYNNAVVKIYNIPVFYLPKLSHPDPTVDRRSGFLPPSFSDSKNLGAGISVPYFWAINDDKNFTVTNNLYYSEHPIFLGEYHQAFKFSNFFADFGYTKGYKKTNEKKRSEEKNHFFSKFTKSFINKNNNENTFTLTTQKVSNDKYLKLYKIKSNLVDYNENTLENSLDFTLETDDAFFGLNARIYETLKENYNDKYEYILPEITLDKTLLSNEKIGYIDYQANLKVHNYDTNKFTNFFVNDLFWNYKDINFKSGLRGKVLANFKNVNYETRNVDLYKDDTTSEIYGALGYLTDLNLQKTNKNKKQFLSPKLLVRYAPGNMRKEFDGTRLDPVSAFNMDRLNNLNNFETGLSASLGLDYKLNSSGKIFDFSIAQILNEKENKKMSSKTSLDEKLSDLVGAANYHVNDKINLNYNFSVDQNYNDLNYNEIGTTIDFKPFKINFNYLQEKKHIGDQKYFNTKLELARNESGLLSIETKRNLITDSAEFYNLSYEYINDCLRAGLVYRREFYTDSELEPENSLLFKITLTPFGNINSPSFNQ